MKGITKLSILAITLLLTNTNNANAIRTTYTIDNSSGFGGTTHSNTPGQQSDILRTNVTSGTFVHDSDTQTLQLTMNFTGDLRDTSGGPDIGDVSGSITYIYDDVLSINSGGRDFLLAITDINNNNLPVPDGQGDGVGQVSFDLTQGNLTQHIVTDLDAKAANLSGLANYSPINSYLGSIGENAYLVLGQLDNSTSIHAWFMSAPFQLNLGNTRTGEYFLTFDLHGSVTPSGTTNIPEPTTILLLGSAILGLPRAVRRKESI